MFYIITVYEVRHPFFATSKSHITLDNFLKRILFTCENYFGMSVILVGPLLAL